MEKLSIKTTHKEEFIDITERVEQVIRDRKIKKGICFLFVPHTTCGLTINENADPSVRADILNKLSEIVPERGHYQHLEGNAPAHIKSVITGISLTIFIENSSLLLGTWQGIYLCEFDGPRTRQVWLKVMEN